MFEKMNCSVARSLLEIGEKWSLLIIREAILETTRFDDFQHRLGIARNILADRLVTLVENRVLEKIASAENARLFDYKLTEKGRDLFGVVAALMHWGDRWLDEGQGPPVVLHDRLSGQPLPKVALVGKDSRPINFNDVRIAAGPGANNGTKLRLEMLNAERNQN